MVRSLKLVEGRDDKVRAAMSLLNHLWPGGGLKERGVKLALWRPKHRAEFFTDLPVLADRAIELAAPGKDDVYFSVCGIRCDYEPLINKPTARGTAFDVRLVPALYVDLDVKPDAFPSMDALIKFVDGLPLPPSALVSSGTGAHAYWALREAVELIGKVEGIRAFDELARGWLEYLRKRSGVKIDSMVDIARVLRLPGTFRVKEEAPRPVEMLRLSNDVRFNLEDFREYALPVTARAMEISTLDTGLVVDMMADPPADKFIALFTNDERFATSYARSKRGDLKDNSPSGHDMSLAAIAARVGWTDQEIVNLLASARRKHNDKPKHPDWYIRTVKRIRMEMTAEQREEEENDRRDDFSIHLAEAESAPPGSVERRHAATEAVRRLTGIELSSVVRYIPEPYRYAIEVVGGKRYVIGDVKLFKDWSSWVDAAINLQFRINPNRPKANEWLSCVQLLSEFAVNETNQEFSLESRTESLIASYISSFGESIICPRAKERHERAFRKAPYIDGGMIFLAVADLLAWADRGGATGSKLLSAEALRRLQFKPVIVAAIRPNGKPSTRSYSAAPLAQLPILRQAAGVEDAIEAPRTDEQ